MISSIGEISQSKDGRNYRMVGFNPAPSTIVLNGKTVINEGVLFKQLEYDEKTNTISIKQKKK